MAGEKLPYFWWHGKDLYEFFATASACGYDNVRIEMHEEDGQAFLHVVNEKTGELLGSYNYSHECPPDCG